MLTSLAAIFEGEPGRLALRHVPTPEPRAGETLVRVVGCTLCGSDLHTFEGRRGTPTPTVLGHEIVGEIAALGEGAPRLDLLGRPLVEGTRITWAIVAACGRCAFCLRGLPQKCQHAVKYGHERTKPGQELRGGLAEHCLLAPGTAIVALPDGLPLEVACPSSCATATVAAAIEAAGPLSGRTVTVHGAGLLGLTAVAFGRSLGAAEVIAVDVRRDRLELATAFGASRVTTPAELKSTVDAATDSLGADVALELSGNPRGFEDAWRSLRIGGTLVAIGAVYPAPAVPLDVEQLVRRCLTLRGVHNYAPRHLVEAVTFLAENHDRLPLANLVGRWYELREAEQAFAAASDPNHIRIGVCGRD